MDDLVMIEEPHPIKKGQIAAISEDGLWYEIATQDEP